MYRQFKADEYLSKCTNDKGFVSFTLKSVILPAVSLTIRLSKADARVAFVATTPSPVKSSAKSEMPPLLPL